MHLAAMQGWDCQRTRAELRGQRGQNLVTGPHRKAKGYTALLWSYSGQADPWGVSTALGRPSEDQLRPQEAAWSCVCNPNPGRKVFPPQKGRGKGGRASRCSVSRVFTGIRNEAVGHPGKRSRLWCPQNLGSNPGTSFYPWVVFSLCVFGCK